MAGEEVIGTCGRKDALTPDRAQPCRPRLPRLHLRDAKRSAPPPSYCRVLSALVIRASSSLALGPPPALGVARSDTNVGGKYAPSWPNKHASRVQARRITTPPHKIPESTKKKRKKRNDKAQGAPCLVEQISAHMPAFLRFPLDTIIPIPLGEDVTGSSQFRDHGTDGGHEDDASQFGGSRGSKRCAVASQGRHEEGSGPLHRGAQHASGICFGS